MNIIIRFLVGVVLLFSIGSCLDENPVYTTNSKIVFASENSAQMALNGVYGLMAVQGSFAQILPEINTYSSGLCWSSFNPSVTSCQYTNGTIPVENEINNLMWGALYQAIANCNEFIRGCENENSGKWTSKLNMIAQAKFLRAVCFYQLFTLYGPIPLRLEPSTLENVAKPRASYQETVDQILSDWTEAAIGLETGMKTVSGKPIPPTRFAAYAYMAKLYWLLGCQSWANEQGDLWATTVLKKSWPEMQSSVSYFQKAKQYGDSVLLKGGFELEPNFNTLFGGKRLEFSKEFVFVLPATANTTENVAYNSLHWTFSPQNSSPGESWGRSQPNKAFFDWAHGTYQDDPRLKATFITEWTRYVNKVPSDIRDWSYPIVKGNKTDTIGWKDTVYVVGLPPVRVPIVKVVFKELGRINYSDFSKYQDPTNPKIEELDSVVRVAFSRTKGPNSWNINDWAYFGKHFTTDCSGRYANNNLYIYRYADFLLLMADVENELGNAGKAMELANKVLARARNSKVPAALHPIDWAGLTQQQIREKVFHERLFELVAEYDGFIDSRRRGINWRKSLLERNNNHHITRACYEHGLKNNYTAYWREYWYPNDGKEDWETFLIRNQLIPIPRMEISSNNMISNENQNPGY